MGGVKLESVHCVKDLGVMITSNLKFSQHCKEAACKANKMLSYKERLGRLNLFYLEKRRPRGKLVECFKILKGFTIGDADKLFSIDNLSRTRSNGIKLRCRQTELDCTKFFFINDTVREWNKLPPSVVQCSTVNSFKNKTRLTSSPTGLVIKTV